MTDGRFDLLVIGGGINGAAIACDAAGRGARVALCEERDFAEGTSSRSSKLIHGGLRYLETYDFRMVREALAEREILLRKAPHLVWPIRLVLPHVEGQRPRWLIRLGLLLYDHLAARRVLPKSESIRLDGHPFGEPLKPAFTHAFAYSDCRGDDARLVIANLLGARAHGATILPRHRFESASRANGEWRIELKNTRSGEPMGIAARALVNAAGPWVALAAKGIAGPPPVRMPRLVRGSHIVVPRQWPGEHGYYLQTADRRTMEMFPYEDGFMSIGTTESDWTEAPENVAVAEAEIDYLLTQANGFLRRPLSRADVVWSYAGVRPLFETGSVRDGDLRTLTRDYSFGLDHDQGAAPLLTVFGGKLTTHRRLAEHALARLEPFLRFPRPSRTAHEALPGGDLEPGGLAALVANSANRWPWLPSGVLRRYARLYGSRLEALIGNAGALADLGEDFGSGCFAREIDFLVETEWALSPDDILWRRTKLGLTLPSAARPRLARYLERCR